MFVASFYYVRSRVSTATKILFVAVGEYATPQNITLLFDGEDKPPKAMAKNKNFRRKVV